MQEITANFKEMKWEDAPQNSQWPGAKIKILREEGKHKTFLIKLPEGFKGIPHVFQMNEQHIVIEGSFKVEGITYGPGTYRFNPAGNAHDGKFSQNGAVILVIQDPLTE